MKIDIRNYPDDDSERHISIEIEDFDTFNLDHTLALVISAALKKFIEHEHGAPFIPNDDVPVELHRDDSAQEPWQGDDNWFERWDWVLAEMHFAFDYLVKDSDADDPYNIPAEIQTRVNNGLRLFGKYFSNLWN